MDVRRLVGSNVRLYREQVGVSQEELAHRAGLDRTYVSGIERGVRNPTILVLQALSDTLGTSPAALLTPQGDVGRKRSRA
jgi:transcriptional regulator with XRE-family HTH domain